MNEPTYDVVMHAYCGMSIPLEQGADKQTAKDTISRFIRRQRKRGRFVEKTGRGTWEVQTPDDAFLISDSDGILTVRRVRTT